MTSRFSLRALDVEVLNATEEQRLVRVASDGDYDLAEPFAAERFINYFPPATTLVNLTWNDDVIHRCIGTVIFDLQSRGYCHLNTGFPDEFVCWHDDGPTA